MNKILDINGEPVVLNTLETNGSKNIQRQIENAGYEIDV